MASGMGICTTYTNTHSGVHWPVAGMPLALKVITLCIGSIRVDTYTHVCMHTQTHTPSHMNTHTYIPGTHKHYAHKHMHIYMHAQTLTLTYMYRH